MGYFHDDLFFELFFSAKEIALKALSASTLPLIPMSQKAQGLLAGKIENLCRLPQAYISARIIIPHIFLRAKPEETSSVW